MKDYDNEYNNFLIVLGQNIKTKRNVNGLSQEKLAFSVDTARNYIGCIERAEKNLSLKTLYKIAKALDVKVEDLLKGSM